MQVKIIATTQALDFEPQYLIEYAGRVCTNSLSRFGQGSERFIRQRIDEQHLGLLEHNSVTFLVTGLSRVASHQLVRHRLGSYAQMSERYVEMEFDESIFCCAEDKEIFDMYNTGRSISELSKTYGKDYRNVTSIVSAGRGSVRPRGDHKTGRMDLFDAPIKSGVDAQLLGLIFADGYVFIDEDSNNCRIGMKMKECHLVRQSQRILGAQKITYLGDCLCQTILSSRTVYDRLVSVYGCIPCKSNIMSPELLKINLPDNMLSHFVRGYFEGDGSIGVYYDKNSGSNKTQITFVSGSKEFIEWIDCVIQRFCDTKKKNIGIIHGGYGSAYRLQYQGIQEINRILKWMYNDVDMRLCHWGKFITSCGVLSDIWEIGKEAIIDELRRINMVCPNSVLSGPEPATIFLEGVQSLSWVYSDLTGYIPREDRRFILPQGVETTILVTMNLRSYLHLFDMRIHPAAQWEIREMCIKMLDQLIFYAPAVFVPYHQELVTKYPEWFKETSDVRTQEHD